MVKLTPLIGSGLRYNLAIRAPEYIKKLVTHPVDFLGVTLSPSIAFPHRFRETHSCSHPSFLAY